MPRLFIMGILLLLVAVPAVGAQQQGCVNQVTVWDGDSLYGIAQRYNVNAVELAQANGLAPNTRLFIGQVLCLDGLVVAQTSTGTTPTTGTTPSTGTTPTTGTTPSTGTTPTTGTTTGTTPTTGTTTGTGGPTTGTTPSTGTVTGTTTPTRVLGFVRGQGSNLPTGWQEYVVAAGDNLYKISQKFAVSLLEVAQANNITNVNIVFLGESLRIPPGSGGTGTPGTPSNVVWTLPNGPNTIPLISIQPNVAKPGSTVTVVGSNYPPNSTVNLYLEKKAFNLKSDVLATVKADANGQFQHQVTIPATWPGGAAINQPTVSISGYTSQGGFWAMNYFVNQ